MIIQVMSKWEVNMPLCILMGLLQFLIKQLTLILQLPIYECILFVFASTVSSRELG